MKMWQQALGYGFLGTLIFIIDRLTKIKAIAAYQDRVMINQFLSFDLAFNRGISWGFFYSSSTPIFVLISILIGVITLVIALSGVRRFLAGEPIIGELLVVVGSLSNIIDRFYYNGVIDFIELSYKEYTWPIFNGADICIVVGIFLMVWEYYKS